MSWLLVRAIDGSIHILLLFPIFSLSGLYHSEVPRPYGTSSLSLLKAGYGPVLLPVFEKAWEQLLTTTDLCSQELTKTWQMYPAETAWHV